MDYHDYMKATGGGIYPMSGSVVSSTSRSSFPDEYYDQDSTELQWKLKSDNIRMRDNYTCRLCGAKDVPFHVHHLRHISGREAWDYEDGDLVTLCVDCHEGMHCYYYSYKLKKGDFAYHRKFKGVGFVEEVNEDSILLDVCWNENEHKGGEEHGWISLKTEARRTEVRPATRKEIDEFWGKVEKYLDTKTILDYLFDYVDEHLPTNHPINARLNYPLYKAQADFAKIQLEISETYGGSLLVSDDDFAQLYDISPDDSDRPIPCPGFIITKKEDMIGLAKEYSNVTIPYDKFDFSKYKKPKKKDRKFYNEYYKIVMRNEIHRFFDKLDKASKEQKHNRKEILQDLLLYY